MLEEVKIQIEELKEDKRRIEAKMLQDDGNLSFDNKIALRNKLVRRYVKQITRICNKNWDEAQVTLI